MEKPKRFSPEVRERAVQLRDGRLSWGRWWKELIPALQPVVCWDGPLPGVVGFTRVMRSAMRNRLRRGEAASH